MNILRRSLVVALTSMLLVFPPVAANHVGTCHFNTPSAPAGGTVHSSSDIAFWGNLANRGHLAVTANMLPDDSATVHGSFRIGLADGVVIFVPASTAGQATCADADGDGVAGIVSLLFEAKQVRTGELVPVSIVPTSDIDSSGTYEVALTIGSDTRVVSMHVSHLNLIHGSDR